MRNAFFIGGGPLPRGTIVAASLVSFGLPSVALAQVNDAERAAARALFKEADQLQRDARFDEALSKFQRAEQLFAAPTNELRIAECEAALGHLAESAESYRTVLRTSLPPGSPAAFQAAVDQARAELMQVEPRVPRLTIMVQPAAVAHPALEIDGQSVPAALIGEGMPLDPGPHRIALSAPGYGSVEETLVLKERESKTALLALKPVNAAGAVAASATPTETGGTNAPAAPLHGPPATGTPPAPPANASPPPENGPPKAGEPPPPPLVVLDQADWAGRTSWKGWLLGAHLGGEWIGGMLPSQAGGASAQGGPTDASNVVAGGFAYGLDAGFRFARRWYVGLVLDHANYQSAQDTSNANTTLFGAVVGATVNPNRTSFYGEAGLAERWLMYQAGKLPAKVYDGGEIEFGAGLWLPVGRSIRLLPKATLTLGTLNSDDGSKGAGHAIFTLALTGFYNLDL